MYDELYRQNVRLIRKIANRFRRACERDNAVDVDDLMQAGFIGLVRADKTYDATAGKSWVSWAAWYITNAIKAELGMRRAVKARTWVTSLDAPLDADDSESITLADTLADDSLPEVDENLMRQEILQTIRDAVEGLKSDQQRQVIRLTLLEGKRLSEAAEALHVSTSRASQIRKDGMRALRTDCALRSLADLDERTRFMAYKGVEAFNRDWTSTVEAAVLWREEQRMQLIESNPSFYPAKQPRSERLKRIL